MTTRYILNLETMYLPTYGILYEVRVLDLLMMHVGTCQLQRAGNENRKHGERMR